MWAERLCLLIRPSPVACLLFIVVAVCCPIEANAYPAPEYALRRTSSAQLFLDYNGDSSPDRIVIYGAPSDVGLVGDFDADTITDFAVYRNGLWYIDFFNDTVADRIVAFGGSTSLDTPVVGDFNNDGKADIGVYRNTGFWYLDHNLNGAPDHISPFGGAAGDVPVVGDFNGDSLTDRAIYRQGLWYVDFSVNGSLDAIYNLGGAANDIPYASDFNNDGIADLIIFRDGVWFIDFDHNATPDLIHFYGAPGDRPLVGFFNTASSVFVHAGANGGQNGSQQAPYATINAALAPNPPPGTIMRIAAGNYPERVVISQESNLTFQGAGLGATHISPSAGDVFTSFLGVNITLRDLHIAGQGPDASTLGRGVVNLGSSMTLERINTLGNRHHNVIGIQHLGTNAAFTIDRSNLSQSQIGNGVELEGGVSAIVTRTNVNGNGTDIANVLVNGGRGVVLTGNSTAMVSFSNVNSNYDGGVLVSNTSSASLHNNTINSNGTNGVYYELQSTGAITGNNISFNGTRGTRGSGGFNGVELNWSSAISMTISGNTFISNTLNGIYIGAGTVNILNNTFRDNFLGLTLTNANNVTTNITVKGNTIELPPGAPYSEGVFMDSSTGASFMITIGGTPTADKNTFRNYGSFPAIHCSSSSINATCSSGGNIFINSSFPVQSCTSCSP